MRRGFANTEALPAYCPLDIGAEYQFKLAHLGRMTLRLDVINAFDQSYELNDGTGIGVGAPRYGNRRGIDCGAAYEF
jgi:outer membrane receptor protein involved in Fe transport